MGGRKLRRGYYAAHLVTVGAPSPPETASTVDEDHLLGTDDLVDDDPLPADVDLGVLADVDAPPASVDADTTTLTSVLLHGGTETPASLGEDPDGIRVRGTARGHGSLLVCAGNPSCVGTSKTRLHLKTEERYIHSF